MITQALLFELFENRGDVLYWKVRPYKGPMDGEAGHVHSRGYLRIAIRGKTYRAHRLIWLWHNGSMPKDQIDHISGDKLDNRIENLRDCTAKTNSRNKPLHRAGRICGVSVRPNGKYEAASYVGKRRVYLGVFATEQEAARAVDNFEKGQTLCVVS